MDDAFLSRMYTFISLPHYVKGFGARYVVRENSLLREVWNVTLLALLVHSAIVMPYKLAFYDFGAPTCKTSGDAYEVWETFVQYGFFFDFIFWFFCSYRDSKDKEVLCLKKIAVNYLCTYFFVNAISCFPLEYIVGSGSAEHGCAADRVNEAGRLFRVSRVSRMARLLRLVRLVRVTKLAALLSSHGLVAKAFRRLKTWWFVQVVNLLAALFFVVHTMACGFWIVGSMESDEASWLTRRSYSDGVPLKESTEANPLYQWMTSVYFVLIVFTTVGLGDIFPVSEMEMIYVAATMIVGAIANSIILSSAITLIANEDDKERALKIQRDMLKNFAQQTQLLPEVAEHLDSWASNTAVYQHKYSREDALALFSGDAMSFNLLNELPDKLFAGDFMKNALLQSCLRRSGFGFDAVPPRFALILALGAETVYLTTGGVVYQSHDSAWNIFLVTEGTFAYVAKHHSSGGVMSMPHSVWTAGEAWAKMGMPFQAMSSIGSIREGKKKKKRRDLDQLLGRQFEEEAELSPYQLVGKNKYFGDLEIFLGISGRICNARCESHGGALLALSSRDLAAVAEEYPSCTRPWRVRARQRYSRAMHNVKKLRSPRNFKTYAVSTIENFYYERLQSRRSGKTTSSQQQAAKNRVTGLAESVEEIPQHYMQLRMDVAAVQHDVAELQKQWDEEVGKVNSILESMVSDLHVRRNHTALGPNAVEVCF